MTSPSPRPGEVWLAYLHFSDRPELGKVRPVIVLEADGAALVAVAAKVTSQDLSCRPGVKALAIDCWRECGLRKPSYVRLDQRFEVPYSDLLRGAPIGSLPQQTLEAVRSAIEGLA